MGEINKVISLILGLVVVILLFAVLTGKINLKNKNFLGLGSKKITPTISVTTTPTPSEVTISSTAASTTYKTYNGAAPTMKPNSKSTSYNATKFQNISTIPSTGSPTLLLPFMGSSLLFGFYLKKKR